MPPDVAPHCHIVCVFAGYKTTVFEGGVRTPAIIRGTDDGAYAPIHRGWQGERYGGVFSATDWYPTLSELAAADGSGGKPLDGISHWPTLQGR